MKKLILLAMMALAMSAYGQDDMTQTARPTPVIFVISAAGQTQIQRAFCLAESIREFAGRYKDAPIWIYVPEELQQQAFGLSERYNKLKVEIKAVTIPEATAWFYLSSMVATAAAAEKDATGKAAVLVFLGSDTVILREPDEFMLAPKISFGYRPVIHKNISPLYNEPLDNYWNRAYALMKIDQSALLPIVTPADDDTIRPYFNAGCMAVRPEKGVFTEWARLYPILCQDSVIKAEAETDTRKRVFTFQVALTGAVLNNLDKSEMIELSDKYNYPIFFRETYGAKKDFHDISEVVAFRYEDFFEKPLQDWDTILKASPDHLEWIKQHLLKE